MKKITTVSIALVMFGAVLAGCSGSNRETVGIIGGGAAGGVIGSAVTGGSTAGAVVGAVGGAVVGREVARRTR